MRRLTRYEQHLFTLATGATPPVCLLQRWRWWLRPFSGLALGPIVFVADDTDVALVCHEVQHVAQFMRWPLCFWPMYFYWLIRVGYRRNPFEREARIVAARARRIALTEPTRWRAGRGPVIKRSHCGVKPMKYSLAIGIALIVLAALALTFQGITYTTKEEVINLGPLKATAETEKTIPLPPALSALVLAIGVGLVIAGARK